MANISYNELFQKIRVAFLFDHPFLSVLTLSLPTDFTTNKYSPFETDGASIKIDTKRLAKYSEDEIKYLYAHTLLHIALKHPYRQKQKDSYIWNKSANIVVNLILSTFEDIGSRPDDEIYDESLKDMCVEEVYNLLNKEKKEESHTIAQKDGTTKAYIYDESKLDIQDVATDSSGKDEQNIDSLIVQALSIANKSQSKYNGMQIEIKEVIKPNISLKDILKEYLISSLFEKVSTYTRPNRKFIHKNLYLPGYKKHDEMLKLYIAIDSSSSVSLDEYKSFLGVVIDICEDFYEYSVTILPFDTDVKYDCIITFDSLNPYDIDKINIPKHDGGTSFDNLLRYLYKSDIKESDLLIVLSDGIFDISENIVSRTLFVLSDTKNMKELQKYGRVIQFNI
jgi:predicted metal-dependent peptidase